MNLRVICLGLGLLSLAANGDPCVPSGADGGTSSGSGSGAGSVVDAGPNGAVCASETNAGSDGTPCCTGVKQPCVNDYECCTGNCSGNSGAGSGSGSGFGSGSWSDAGSSCGDPAVPTCIDALSSRCNTGECECTSDADCCIGVCAPTALPGTGPTTTLRCCQPAGQPCGANSDCCDLTCDPTSFQCD